MHINSEAFGDKTIKLNCKPAPIYWRQAPDGQTSLNSLLQDIEWQYSLKHKVQTESAGPNINSLVPKQAKPEFWCTILMSAAVGKQQTAAITFANALSTIEIRDLQDCGSFLNK
jgi:hypothetical protein